MKVVHSALPTLLYAGLFAAANGQTNTTDITTYGTTVQISTPEVEYDQNQNHAEKESPILDGTSIEANGNLWVAYPFVTELYDDSILTFNWTLTEDTEDGFQALCLDADTELTGSDGKCFVLRSTQGMSGLTAANWVIVPVMASVGETIEITIPVGKFLTGTVNYLGLIQDSDGADKGLGGMVFRDLVFSQHMSDALSIDVNGSIEYIANDQLTYTYKGDKNQDNKNTKMGLAEDGSGMQINGNVWKAMDLPEPYNVTTSTVLEVELVIDEKSECLIVGLDDDLDASTKPSGSGHSLVTVHSSRDKPTWTGYLTDLLVEGENRRVTIPIGLFMNLGEGEFTTVTYLIMIQDNDVNKYAARSTWSNFRLYETARDPFLMNVFGNDITIPNVQNHLAYTNQRFDQDSRQQILSIADSGRSITATGNNWKYLDIAADDVFNVTKTTVLKYEFDLSSPIGEQHAICMLNKDYLNDQRKDCFSPAGTQGHDSRTMVKGEPFNAVGSTTYELTIGKYFQGPVSKIGIVLDNDATKSAGQSTWSNVEIYSLPTLNVGVPTSSTRLRSATPIGEDNLLKIQNIPLQYDTSQDSSSNLAIVSEENGGSINFLGNVWRAYQLDTPLSWDDLGDFIVSFDFSIEEAGEIHAICIDENREYGDVDNPKVTPNDPKRCVAVGVFQNLADPANLFVAQHLTPEGGSHRYVLNLGKMFERRYADFNYLAFISDNDQGDKTGGNVTFSNMQLITDLDSCLEPLGFEFTFDDCSIENVLSAVEEKLIEESCANTDPLLELMALFDATQEMEVYKTIQKTCASAYGPHAYDFTRYLSNEGQLVREYIDGAYWTQEDAPRINHVNDKYASSNVFTYPDHHALKNCDIGAAMCCFVTHKDAPLESPAASSPNAEMCYTDIEYSRYSAHVRKGFSVYGEDGTDDVMCHGFAWGTDHGSVDAALAGNALFKIGFMSDFYTSGNIEQVPAVPLCGCIDRMPVVTNAKCSNAVATGSTVVFKYDTALKDLTASFTLGEDGITYGDCGGENLIDHYKTLAADGKADDVAVAYMESRIVGEGGCSAATSAFLGSKYELEFA